jgi:hypothetical protein
LLPRVCSLTLTALLTQTSEFDVPGLNITPTFYFIGGLQLVKDRPIEVIHSFAAGTDKVVVKLEVTVIAAAMIQRLHALDNLTALERMNGSINCVESNGRDTAPDTAINLLR